MLLERGDELARIEAALRRGAEGRGGFVMVEGTAGIGKTAVLRAACDRASALGMRVLRSRGAELEREFAFGVVRQMLEPTLAEAAEEERGDLLDGAAGLAAERLGLPGASPGEGDAIVGPEPPFVVLHGLYWLIANLAAGSPVCLVVDDAHWADAASLRFVAFLLTRLEGLAVAVVIATRPSERGADPGFVATLAADSGAEVVRLGPLTHTRRRAVPAGRPRRDARAPIRRRLSACDPRDAVPDARAGECAARGHDGADRGGRRAGRADRRPDDRPLDRAAARPAAGAGRAARAGGVDSRAGRSPAGRRARRAQSRAGSRGRRCARRRRASSSRDDR